MEGPGEIIGDSQSIMHRIAAIPLERAKAMSDDELAAALNDALVQRKELINSPEFLSGDERNKGILEENLVALQHTIAALKIVRSSRASIVPLRITCDVIASL